MDNRKEPQQNTGTMRKCPHHQDVELVGVCLQCGGILICSRCAFSFHLSHTVDMFSNSIPQIKCQILDFVNKTAKEIPSLRKEIDSVDVQMDVNHKSSDECVQEILRQRDAIHKQLEDRTRCIIDICRNNEERNRNLLEQYKLKLQDVRETKIQQLYKHETMLRVGTNEQLYEFTLTSPTSPEMSRYPEVSIPSFTTGTSDVSTAFGDILFIHTKEADPKIRQTWNSKKQQLTLMTSATNTSTTSKEIRDHRTLQKTVDGECEHQPPTEQSLENEHRYASVYLTDDQKSATQRKISEIESRVGYVDLSSAKRGAIKTPSSQSHQKERVRGTRSPSWGVRLQKRSSSCTLLYHYNQETSSEEANYNGQMRLLSSSNENSWITLSEFKHGPYRITSLTPVAANRAWLCDYDDTFIMLVDHEGQELRKITMEVCVTDIGISTFTGSLWLCSSSDNSVREITKHGQITVKFHTTKRPLCISVSVAECIFIGVGQQVLRYSKNGTMKCETSKSNKPVVKYPNHIAECPATRNVAVADWDDVACGGDGVPHVVLLNNKLQVVKSPVVVSSSSFYPHDVCFTSRGQLVVADFYNRSVLLLSGAGDYLRTLYTHDKLTATTVGVQMQTDTVWTVYGYKNVRIMEQFSTEV